MKVCEWPSEYLCMEGDDPRQSRIARNPPAGDAMSASVLFPKFDLIMNAMT